MAKIPRIAVVGSANIDLTTFTDRFPKPGETIFGQKFNLGFGGKGANQATAAKLCGAAVFMVARVGSDLFGPATIENFKKLGIDTTHVKQVEGVSSGVAPIFVEPSGQNRIFVVKGANDELKPADVDAASDLLKAVECIVLQFEIPLETVYHTIAFAQAADLPPAQWPSCRMGNITSCRRVPRHAGMGLCSWLSSMPRGWASSSPACRRGKPGPEAGRRKPNHRGGRFGDVRNYCRVAGLGRDRSFVGGSVNDCFWFSR
jgi:hypothetical protein